MRVAKTIGRDAVEDHLVEEGDVEGREFGGAFTEDRAGSLARFEKQSPGFAASDDPEAGALGNFSGVGEGTPEFVAVGKLRHPAMCLPSGEQGGVGFGVGKKAVRG